MKLHLGLAAAQGKSDEVRAQAVETLKNALLTMLRSGFGAEARLTVSQFRGLFSWYWRAGTYLLTIFPQFTAAMGRLVTYLAHVLGLEKQVSRRWVYPKEEENRVQTKGSGAVE
jgi:hypothetical protein